MSVTVIAAGWWHWMSAMLWQSTVLILAIAVATRLLRGRAWPELIHGLWLLVPVKLVLPPHLPSAWRTPLAASSDARDPAAEMSSIGPFLYLWAAGVLVVLVATWSNHRRYVRRALALSRPASLRSSEAAERAAKRLGLRRPVQVRELCAANDGAGAFATGCRRPIVLLPRQWAAELDDVALEHVLLHELAHIKRGDLWLENLFALLQALYWFHPLVWIARRRCRVARELACDATVARCLGDPGGYRDTLLVVGAANLTETPLATSMGLLSMGLLERRSLLLDRLDALQRAPRTNRGVRRAATAIAVLGTAALLLPLARPAVTEPSELDRARADLAALAGRDDVGSLHLRWAVARVQMLEQGQPAGPPSRP
jgi:beta-lactamase regulating signal transducer with metallopeptidase domain